MSECVFCKIISGTLLGSFVHQDEICVAFLDINPVNPGHLLVVPTTHVKSVADLDDEQAAHLLKIGRDLLRGMQKSSLKLEGANFLISDGEVAGQEVPHTHLHIVPRFSGDKQRFGFSHSASKREELDLIANEIRALL